jgi:hypothetical protein
MNITFRNRVYDILKPVTTTLLPGAGALYFALAGIWGFPNGEQVVGTIAAVNVFLGLFVTISSATYNRSDKKYDGDIEVVEDPDGKLTFGLGLNTVPEDLKDKQQVLFRVNKKF